MKSYTKDQIIKALIHAQNEIGNNFTYADYKEWRLKKGERLPSLGTIQRIMGSWNLAKKEAKLKLDTMGSNTFNLTFEEVLDILKMARRDIDGRFTCDKYTEWARNNNYPTYVTIKRKFGWTDLIKLIEEDDTKKHKKQLKKHQVTLLKIASEELGVKLTYSQYCKWLKDNQHVNSVFVCFDSWNEAKKEAGLLVNSKTDHLRWFGKNLNK